MSSRRSSMRTWATKSAWAVLYVMPSKHYPRYRSSLSAPLGSSQSATDRTNGVLSWTSKGSVNDGISSTLCSLTYASIDDAVGLLRTLGAGVLMAKLDLKQGWRQSAPKGHSPSSSSFVPGYAWKRDCFVPRRAKAYNNNASATCVRNAHAQKHFT